MIYVNNSCRESTELQRQVQTMSDKLSVLSATNTNLEAMVRDRSSADSVARDNVNIELQLQSLTAKYDEEKKTRQEYGQKVCDGVSGVVGVS